MLKHVFQHQACKPIMDHEQ